MLLNKKTWKFLLNLKDRVETPYFDGVCEQHTEIESFRVCVDSQDLYRHIFSDRKDLCGEGFKGKILYFHKPIIKMVTGGEEFINIRLESSSKLELVMEMSMTKFGWTAKGWIINHNRRWRWSEHYKNGNLTRTFVEHSQYVLRWLDILI